jgi:hypothetical protein
MLVGGYCDLEPSIVFLLIWDIPIVGSDSAGAPYLPAVEAVTDNCDQDHSLF